MCRERLPTNSTVEVAPLEQKQRQLEHTRLANLEGKFLSTLRRGTTGAQLFIGRFNLSWLFYHNPGPHFGKVTHERAI